VVEPIVVVDLSALSSWNSEWTALRVAVSGLDARAFSVVDTLAELGASVIVIAAPGELSRLSTVVGATVLDLTGDAAHRTVADFEPDVVFSARERRFSAAAEEWSSMTGAAVWSDIDLAWRVRDKVRVAQWVAVTGASDTTLAVDLGVHLLAAGGVRVVSVGAKSIPVLDAIRDPLGFDALIVEYSPEDLALQSATPVSPLLSVCMTAGDERLHDALGRVYENTTMACVYNKSDEATMRMVEQADVVDGCRAIGFDLGSPGVSDVGIVDGIVVDRAFNDDRRTHALELTTHGELASAGLGDGKSVESVLVAAACARAFGVAPESIAAGIRSFVAIEH
jgi:UDP-N-acetylmuramoylalanine--D-glutamate ligase